MILMPGAVLMSFLSYSMRLLIFVSLGVGALVPFLLSMAPTYQQIIQMMFIFLLVYLGASSSHLTRHRLKLLHPHIHQDKGLSTLPLSRGDAEFNEIVNHINSMLRSLERKNELLSSCAKEAFYTSNELQISSNDVASGAHQEFEALDSLAATSEEMSTAIGDISQRLTTTTTMAKNTFEQSNKGKAALETLKTRLDAMQGMVTSNRDQIQELNAASVAIRQFVETIDQITTKINLLSLNAAIESARAGEAGRGFAVVANEVRTLASSTEEATRVISTLVEGIADKVAASNQNSLSLMELTNNASKATSEASDRLAEIETSAFNTEAEISLSHTLMREFSVANDQMCERLQKIASVSETHSQASKDTKDMVHYLEWLSSRLEQKET